MKKNPIFSSLSKESAVTGLICGGVAMAGLWYLAQRVVVPSYVRPVEDFDMSRYLGHWYEVARIDFFYERGLTSCSASYSLSPDGSIEVLNRGFNSEKNKWKSATAVAQFIGDTSVGALKVSFFGPFYAGYFVVHVDENYQHAVVIGDGAKYCWVLSRSPDISDLLLTELLTVAAANGVDVDRMHRVNHDVIGD